MSGGQDGKPLLASLVQSGNEQGEAEKINGFITMVKDISNAYLVNTGDGDVLVNTGFMDNGERNKALFAPHRSGPLRKIVITQSHPDHYGGVPQMREDGTQVIAHRSFNDTIAYYKELGPYLARRSAKLWGHTVRRKGPPSPPPVITIDQELDRHLVFEVGGRRFELFSTPGGETLDALSVWMPDEAIVFTGNLFGPIFMAVPNLCTTRGDKPRSVDRYLRSLELIRDLDARLLITGHGAPIEGQARIRADLEKLHAAVSHIRQATIEGMNAGTDMYTLMRTVSLPDNLKVGEYHGKVSWAVRTIWEEYSGWVQYDSTTNLYAVPHGAIDDDLVELAGGAGRIVQRARARLAAGAPLHAIHLLDVALHAAPANAEALGVMKDALLALQAQAGGQNLSEVMWLRSELAEVEKEEKGLLS